MLIFYFLCFILQLIDDNHALLADNNGKESEEARGATLQEDTGFIVLPFRTNSEKKINLETNDNRIKDKELYEQDTTKHNNVNERSFIYINQKFKTPVVNQLYSSHDLLREAFKSLVSNVDNTNYNQNPPKETPGYSVAKPNREYFEANIARSETKQLYFPPSDQYHQVTNKESLSENKVNFTPKRPLNKVTDEQREYVELLKPPLLRPVLISDKKENRLWTLPDKLLSNYQPLTKNLHVPSLPVDPHQFSMTYYDNFGFPTPYGYQRSAPQYSNKHDEFGMVTDSSAKKVIKENNKVEANKHLERYLKESLEDQVTNERLNIKNDNCNYSNCILKPTKQLLNSRVKGDPECKCGRRLNILKQRESTGFEDKETNNKESVVSTETNTLSITAKSSELSDYGDILAEEMNLKKLIED